MKRVNRGGDKIRPSFDLAMKPVVVLVSRASESRVSSTGGPAGRVMVFERVFRSSLLMPWVRIPLRRLVRHDAQRHRSVGGASQDDVDRMRRNFRVERSGQVRIGLAGVGATLVLVALALPFGSFLACRPLTAPGCPRQQGDAAKRWSSARLRRACRHDSYRRGRTCRVAVARSSSLVITPSPSASISLACCLTNPPIADRTPRDPSYSSRRACHRHRGRIRRMSWRFPPSIPGA